MEQPIENTSCFVSDSEISYLLHRLTAMSKKPTIEAGLSQALDEYLNKLNECEKYLEHGIFNMNFAEAALLLQSSADIYSKKVDLLWDIIFDYQKRLLLNDAQNANKEEQIQKLEERKSKYKRKRKTKESEQQTSKLVNSFSFEAAEYVDYVNAIYEQNDLLSEWDKFHVPHESKSSPSLNLGKDSLFLPNTAIYTEDGEYVGRYDQFHFASLVENIFDSDNVQEEREPSHITRITIDSYVHNDFLLEKSLCAVPEKAFSTELTQHIDDFVAKQSCAVEQLSRKEVHVNVERLPSPLNQKELRRCSNADSLFDDDNFSSVSENCTDSCVDHNENHVKDVCDDEIDPITGSIEKRNKSCSQDSAFYEMEDEEQPSIDDRIDTPLPERTRTSIVNKQPCCGGSVVISSGRVTKRKAFMNTLKLEDFREEKIKKRKTIKKKTSVSEKALKRLSTGVTANLKDFERFCRTQYRPAEGEGEVPPNSDSSSDEEAAAESSDDDDEDSVAEPFTADYDPLPEPVEEPDLEEPEVPVETPAVVSVPPPPKPKAPVISSPQLEQLRRNIREWRDFIIPKLKNLQNRSDFDIHEYGSRIMEGSRVGEEREFGSMIRGKGAAEVARYFLATLQLATTSNVEIVGAAPGRLANDTFKVKTLDKTRYHELLDEYQAPSEETFRDRLERAQASNPKVPLHSTPSIGSPKKRIKLATLQKKLF